MILYVSPKAIHREDGILFQFEGKSRYSLTKSRLESLFYSETIVAPKFNELLELERILNIDFSIFFQQPKIFVPREYLDLYFRYEEMQGKRTPEGLALKKLIEESREKFINDYMASNEGWMAINDLRKVVETLLEKIHQNPDYHLQINYNRPWWGKYFHMDENKEEEKKLQEEKKINKELLDRIQRDAQNSPQWQKSSDSSFFKFQNKVKAEGKKLLQKEEETRRLYKDIPPFLKLLDQIQDDGYKYVTLFND